MACRIAPSYCKHISQTQKKKKKKKKIAIETAGIQRECISTKRQQQKRNNDWTFNMKRRIDDLRGDISRISQMSLSNPSTKIKKNKHHSYNR